MNYFADRDQFAFDDTSDFTKATSLKRQIIGSEWIKAGSIHQE